MVQDQQEESTPSRRIGDAGRQAVRILLSKIDAVLQEVEENQPSHSEVAST
jgi:hypothetical protein